MAISHILPSVLEDEKIWVTLFKAMDEIVGNTADSRIRILMNRHNLEYFTNIKEGLSDDNGPRVYEPGVKEDTPEVFASIKALANLTGYNYRDSGKLDADTYIRMIESAISYIPYKGTKKFVDFFSYVLNKNIEILPLWYDYQLETFYRENDPSLATRRFDANSGTKTAFPTPYVDIEMDPELITIFSLQEIMDLFYSVTSFDIVIRQAIFGFRFDPDYIYIYAGPRDIFKEITVTGGELNLPSLPSIIKSGDVGSIFKVEPSKVFSNTAATTPSNYGDKVARVNSISDNTKYFVQSDINRQPIFGRRPTVGRRNLIERSQEFDHTKWVKTNLNISQNTTETTDPFGGNAASKIIPTVTSGLHTIHQTGLILPPNTYNLSVYVKPDIRSIIYISSLVGTTTYKLVFDSKFRNVVSNQNYTNVIVEPLENGWSRLSVQLVADDSVPLSNMFVLGVRNLQNDTFIGDNISGLYLYGVAIGNQLYPYQKVVSQYDVTQTGIENVHYLNFTGNELLQSSATLDFSSSTQRSFFVSGIDRSTANNKMTLLNCSASNSGGVRLSLNNNKDLEFTFKGSTDKNIVFPVSAEHPRNIMMSVSDGNVLDSTDIGGSFDRSSHTLNYTNTSMVIGGEAVATNRYVGEIYAWGWSNRASKFSEIQSTLNWMKELQPDNV